jgi:hypothetical protein
MGLKRSKAEAQRRFIQRRAEQILARVNQMDDEELRWTVRLFADCLAPSERRAQLGPYNEHWGVDELRRFVLTFVRQYTRLALAELESKAGRQGAHLGDLTEEELQSMALAEKWQLLAADPEGLAIDQLRRELARLFMCKSYDLFHDPGLGQAVVEYPAYHRTREALESVPDPIVLDLARLVLTRAAVLSGGTAREIEITLGQLHEAIARALGVTIPADQLFAHQMARLPFDERERTPDPGAAAAGMQTADQLPAEELDAAVLTAGDLMRRHEWEEHFLPLRRQFGSLDRTPPEQLRALLGRVAGRVAGRGLTDFAERYRTGQMMADRKLDPHIWEMLTSEERLSLLERDNRAMDPTQAARHLVKILFSYTPEALFDADFHRDLLRHPTYQRLVNRLAGMIERRQEDSGLGPLTSSVTRMMLELAGASPAEQPGRLQAIRIAIAAALGVEVELTYQGAREGQA